MNKSALAQTGTFSKSQKMWGLPDDLVAEAGEGSRVWLKHLDSSAPSKSYIDWVCGLGANLLGYGNEDFVNSLEGVLWDGTGFSLPHELEYVVAEKLVNLLGNRIKGWSPDDISVRFAKTGTDATTMAVRLARAVTGQAGLIHSGYSGWASEFVTKTPPAHGIPVDHRRHIYDLPFNSSIMLMRHQETLRGKYAAIMLEQGIEEPASGWYGYLRDTCNGDGALLIMDEVVTGLRYGLGGASELYGVEPDLIVMGKALGGCGMPISALIGRKEYMDWFARNDPVFCSSTNWGEVSGLAAADAVLDIWGVNEVGQIWQLGDKLIEGMNDSGWMTVGHAPRSLTKFCSEYERAIFIHFMFENGILMNRPNFINLAHTIEDIETTVKIAKDARQYANDLLEQYGTYQSAVENEGFGVPRVLFSNR